ncbi:MAG: type II secretion system F family protein [Candidatus Kerfeldbacteria bacterium]|nr:type II secretion system F family protein [Candidatus Kerfeldbacteria bacterium]
MGTFFYSALDLTNSHVKGKVDARSSRAAVATLEREGFQIINLREEKGERFSRFQRSLLGVSTQEKIFFTRNLYTMLESGIALDQAVKTTAEQTTNGTFREALLDIYQRIQKGQTLHSALSQHRQYFPEFFVNVVRVGETSGRLDEVLSFLLEKQEKDYDLKTKARGAMIYPAIILTALVVMVVSMLVFVIPRISDVLHQYDVTLPLATRILLWLSNFLLHYGLYMLPAVVVLLVLFRRATRAGRGKWRWDSFVLAFPRINTIVREFNLAQFSRSLSALLKSGMSIDQALDLAAGVTTNSHYQRTIRSGIPFIQKGIPLSEILKGHPKLFPPLTSRMVEVGEKAGKLDHMLTRLAAFYEKSVQNSLTNFSAVIEPVLLLCIGLAVGFVAIAVLTPIWSFSKTI